MAASQLGSPAWATIALIVLGITLVGLFGKSDFWSIALPAYLTGAGTLAAAVPALGVAVWSDRRQRLAVEDQRQRRAASEAAKVLALCGLDAGPGGGIRVFNVSDGPIFEVVLATGEQEVAEGLPDPPWRWVPGNGYGASFTPVVSAGESWAAGGWWTQSVNELPHRDSDGNDVGPPNYLTARLGATIRWTDAAGMIWKRRGRQAPELISERDPLDPYATMADL